VEPAVEVPIPLLNVNDVTPKVALTTIVAVAAGPESASKYVWKAESAVIPSDSNHFILAATTTTVPAA